MISQPPFCILYIPQQSRGYAISKLRQEIAAALWLCTKATRIFQ